MSRTWKKVLQLIKRFTLGKTGRTYNSVSHLEKWVTIGKVGHNFKNMSHLNGSHLEKHSHLKKSEIDNTLKNKSRVGHTLKKWVKLKKVGHSCIGGSQLYEFLKLGKTCHKEMQNGSQKWARLRKKSNI